ncbi:MAG: polysaccharide deacetylase family protein, partial [Pirellulaceae bacterium]|nr:polysaccharide deacetylase family protein [Pirellulaceae bacterium]
MLRLCFIASAILFATSLCGQLYAQTNPLAYLDHYADAYYPGTDFPKLTTPQWIGEEGVDAVVTLGIDDMRDTAKYEAFLRRILDRLKQIDGRAAVSIMTCKIDPTDPQLQDWLAEGLSLETHTIAHPCPCLQGGDFAKAKATYDECVDMMYAVPGNHPVAFRFPCMDSKNTPSPRAFAEIINKTTGNGNFLQASTSVVNVFKSNDPQLPQKLTLNADGSERFERYIPFESFVNKIENYPYPYVIDRLCWEFPCTIPDDWQAQNIQQPNNPRTVDDMVAAIDATVIKQGIANIIFHPHNWIRNDQMVAVIDRVQEHHGRRVKFLTFKECVQRINDNLLLGQPIRAADGGDNGVRIVDLNQDGFLDVMIGNENLKVARIWQPATKTWHDMPHDVQFTRPSESGRIDLGVRFGQLSPDRIGLLVNNEKDQAIYQYTPDEFVRTSL